MRWLDGITDSMVMNERKVKSLSRVQLFATPWTVCSPPDSSVHGILQARILEWVAISFSRGSSQLRDRTQVSRIVGGFFTRRTTREAQEYEVGSLCLLHRIFPTQGSNPGLPHCRRTLYQLSHQGSPHIKMKCTETWKKYVVTSSFT